MKKKILKAAPPKKVKKTKVFLCPHCHTRSDYGYFSKAGLERNGVQRYLCKHCESHFNDNTKILVK